MSYKTHRWKSVENILQFPTVPLNHKKKLTRSINDVNCGIKIRLDKSDYFHGTKFPVDFIFHQRNSIKSRSSRTSENARASTDNLPNLSQPVINYINNEEGMSNFESKRSSGKTDTKPTNTATETKSNVTQTDNKPTNAQIESKPSNSPTASKLTNTETESKPTNTETESKPDLLDVKSKSSSKTNEDISAVDREEKEPSIKSIPHSNLTMTGSEKQSKNPTFATNSQSKLSLSIIDTENPLNVNMRENISGYHKIHEHEYVEIVSMLDARAFNLQRFNCFLISNDPTNFSEMMTALEDFKNSKIIEKWGTFRLMLIGDGFSIPKDILVDADHLCDLKRIESESQLGSANTDQNFGDDYMPIAASAKQEKLPYNHAFETDTNQKTEISDNIQLPLDVNDPNFQWPKNNDDDDDDDELGEDEEERQRMASLANKFRDSRIININKQVQKLSEAKVDAKNVSHHLITLTKAVESNIGVAHHTSLEIMKDVEQLHDLLYDVFEDSQ